MIGMIGRGKLRYLPGYGPGFTSRLRPVVGDQTDWYKVGFKESQSSLRPFNSPVLNLGFYSILYCITIDILGLSIILVVPLWTLSRTTKLQIRGNTFKTNTIITTY